MKNSKKTIKFVALLLAFCTLVCIFAACDAERSDVDSPVLEYQGEGIPASFYQLLLSRTKGTLARNHYDVKSEGFWDGKVEGGDVTYEDYFNEITLESCKSYLCALAFFESEGLRLPESVIAAIEEEIEFYVSLGYVGGGSADKLDEVLAPYGVDAESLKEAYLIEAKHELLLTYLYGADASLISDTVKEDFYRENYYRFKQIILPNFYYEYEVDDFGDEIYFDEETGRRLYDEKNGAVMFDANGNYLKDENGDEIYFDASGSILYDKVNGKRSVVLDGNGEAKKFYYTDRELEKREALVGEIVASLDEGDFTLFESKMAEYNLDFGDGESYPDGYYLSRIEEGGYEGYMLDMLDALEDIEVGEVAHIKSEHGHHIIMKYELDAGKYASGAYSEWFASFNSALINKMFEQKCNAIKGDITVVEENLVGVSIKDIGVNFDY